MGTIVDKITSANANYAVNCGDKGDLAMPPARRFAILSCMETRLEPAQYIGPREGDADVISNAGVRASDDAYAL